MDNKIKIFVITHKKYKFPENEIYIPLHVGKNNKESLGYIGDDTGDNISYKNSNYCELTGLYWMWKNVNDCNIIGLNHYRRYFTIKNNIFEKDKFKLILTTEQIENLMNNYDIVVSNKKRILFKNVYQNYAQQHYIKDLDKCKEIISKKCPEYIDSFDKIMNQNKMSICNMFITKKEIMDNYSKWLFDILFELEKNIDMTGYSKLQKRVYGFLSERLFNVWLEKNSNLRIGYLPIIKLEHDSLKTIIKKSYKRIMKIKS